MRAMRCATLGPDAEALAWRYAQHPWNAGTVESLIERARAQDGEARALAAIRLDDTLRRAPRPMSSRRPRGARRCSRDSWAACAAYAESDECRRAAPSREFRPRGSTAAQPQAWGIMKSARVRAVAAGRAAGR
jgi:hypothetical protein